MVPRLTLLTAALSLGLVSVPFVANTSAFAAGPQAAAVSEIAIDGAKILELMKTGKISSQELASRLKGAGIFSEKEAEEAAKSPLKARDLIEAKDAAMEKNPAFREEFQREVARALSPKDAAKLSAEAVTKAKAELTASAKSESGIAVHTRRGVSLVGEAPKDHAKSGERHMTAAELKADVLEKYQATGAVSPEILSEASDLADYMPMAEAGVKECVNLSTVAATNLMKIEKAGARELRNAVKASGRAQSIDDLTVEEMRPAAKAEIAEKQEEGDSPKRACKTLETVSGEGECHFQIEKMHTAIVEECAAEGIAL